MTHAPILNVGAVVSSTQYGLSDPSDESGSIPLVGMKDIQDGRVNLNPMARVSLSSEDFEKYRLLKGDILLNRTNSPSLVGKAAIVEEDADVVFASYLVRVTVDRQKASPEYINYWINSDRGQKQIKALATRAVSQANLNPTTFCDHFYLPVPGLQTQQHIAAVLKAWDDTTDKLGTLIVALERRKQGLMQQLLIGRKRLKGFKGKWKLARVGSFASDYRSINTAGQALPVLSCTKYAGLVDSLQYFNKQVFSENTTTYKIVKRGQFVYATNHIEEGSIGYQDLCDAALVSPMYTVFDPNAALINHRFLYMLLKTEAMRRVFEATTHSSVDRRGSLRWPEFAKLKINIPPVPEQERIVDVLTDASHAVDLAKQQLDELKTQKRALMQKLLSGEWRLPEPPAQSKTTSKKGLQPANTVRKQLSKK